MTKFNLWFGQTRPKTSVRGRPVEMYHRHVAPCSEIQLENRTVGVGATSYKVDLFGNIEVTEPDHLHDMSELGWPMFVGGDAGVVHPADLTWFMDPLETEPWRPLSTAEHEMHTRAVARDYITIAGKFSGRNELRLKTVTRMWDDIMCTLAGNQPDLSSEQRQLFSIPTVEGPVEQDVEVEENG